MQEEMHHMVTFLKDQQQKVQVMDVDSSGNNTVIKERDSEIESLSSALQQMQDNISFLMSENAKLIEQECEVHFSTVPVAETSAQSSDGKQREGRPLQGNSTDNAENESAKEETYENVINHGTSS